MTTAAELDTAEDVETAVPVVPVWTSVHAAILEFERYWFKYAGAKESVIFERFGITATRYFQMLDWAIDQPEAMAYDAQTTNRLLRIRTLRQAKRSRSPAPVT